MVNSISSFYRLCITFSFIDVFVIVKPDVAKGSDKAHNTYYKFSPFLFISFYIIYIISFYLYLFLYLISLEIVNLFMFFFLFRISVVYKDTISSFKPNFVSGSSYIADDYFRDLFFTKRILLFIYFPLLKIIILLF